MSQSFTLDAVLTVTSGFLLCPIDELYRILNYLTGQNLYTHQLPRAADYAAPYILKQYPELAKIGIPEISTNEQVEDFLYDLIQKGINSNYELEPMSDFIPKNPIQELIEMRGSTEGIIIATTD